MKIKIRYKYWQVILGIICLCLLAAILYFSTGAYKQDPNAFKGETTPGSLLTGLHSFFYIATVIYFALNYYYNLITWNKKISSFLKFSVILIACAFAYLCLLYYIFPAALHEKYESPGKMLASTVSSTIPILIICYLFAYLTVLREALKQKKILEAQKLLLETQISQANFNFLKAQINPHFLHNTLNFLYARSLPYSSELSEGILTLSDIMRYALRQGNQNEGKAPLKDEIEHVNNVIRINQLRYSNQLKVNFKVSGELNGSLIIPFVLITLVENAFKHGDLKNQEHPIDIKLNVEGEKLYFYCSNKKKSGPKELSTGIGLGNIKSRLALAYGSQFKLNIKDEQEFYTTELTIDKL